MKLTKRDLEKHPREFWKEDLIERAMGDPDSRRHLMDQEKRLRDEAAEAKRKAGEELKEMSLKADADPRKLNELTEEYLFGIPGRAEMSVRMMQHAFLRSYPEDMLTEEELGPPEEEETSPE